MSDEIQIRKYNILHRGLAEGGDAGQACAGFLARASRFYGQTPLFGQEHVIGPNNEKYYWIRSLLERMDECDLRINVGGSKLKGYYGEQILDEEKRDLFNAEERQVLIDSNIMTIGDLVEWNGENYNWIDFRRINMSFLERIAECRRIPNDDIHLRQGTFYGVVEVDKMYIYEYIGVAMTDDKPAMMIRKWSEASGSNTIETGDDVQISTLTPSRGGGTDHCTYYEGLFPCNTCCKVILGEKEKRIYNGKNITTRKVLRLMSQQNPVYEPYDHSKLEMLQEIVDTCNENNMTDYATYTDAGRHFTTKNIDVIFNLNPISVSSGGIVMLSNDDNWREKPMLFIELTDDPAVSFNSVFPVEVLCMVVALKLRKLGAKSTKYWTDCKSIIDILKDTLKMRKNDKKDNITLITELIREARTQNIKEDICWVNSHQDDLKTESEWTKEETGNILADKLAGQKYDYIYKIVGTENQHNIKYFSFTIKEILESMSEDFGLYISQNGTPNLSGLRDHFNIQKAHEYNHIRNLFKAESSHDWFDMSLEFANLVWNFEKLTADERHSINRIVYNKLWQPYNIYRYEQEKNKPNPNVSNKCPACGLIDPMEHLLKGCDTEQTREIWQDGTGAFERMLAEMENTTVNKQIVKIVLELLNQVDSHHIWLATWQPRQKEYFKKRFDMLMPLDALKEKEVMKIQSTLIIICSVLAKFAQRLIRYRIHVTNEERLSKKFPLRKPQKLKLIHDIFTAAIINRKGKKKKKQS